jgi:elongation factor P
MPTIDISDIERNTKVLIEGQPYVVVERQFVKPGKGSAFTRTKMKNLLTGGVIERNIRSGEKMELADIEEKTMQFLYREGEDFVFMDNSSYEQTHISDELVSDDARFLKDNLTCSVLFFNARPIGVSLPNFVELKVIHSEPGVKGDTSGGATKPATLETGATINVPLFINEGETLQIDTRTGQYVARVKV